LGLGTQGSTKHNALIKKWFPNDRIASILLKQECFQPSSSSSSSSSFRDYDHLKFEKNRDTITVYSVIVGYDHGNSKVKKSKDKWLIKEHEIVVINQNFWKFRSVATRK
jgi:hypothetical protein